MTVPHTDVGPVGFGYKRRWIKPAPTTDWQLRFNGGDPSKLYWFGFHPQTEAKQPVEDFEGALP